MKKALVMMLLLSIISITSCISSKHDRRDSPISEEQLEGRWALRSYAKKLEEDGKIIENYDHRVPSTFRIQNIFKKDQVMDYLIYFPESTDGSRKEELKEDSATYELNERQLIVKIKNADIVTYTILLLNKKEMHLQTVSEYSENGKQYKSSFIRRFEKI